MSPPNRLLYPLIGEKLAVLKEYLDECRQKGYITLSRSLTGVPVLLVRKYNGR